MSERARLSFIIQSKGSMEIRQMEGMVHGINHPSQSLGMKY